MNLPVPANASPDLQLLQQMQGLLAERDQKIASLEHQLNWFKQQLFGEKSEKRLIDNPDQLALGEILKDKPAEQDIPTETITYLIEKYRYHAPLYRQHQKLESSGITLSRGTLTHLEQRAGQLLKPIADEVLKSCLESEVLALDETPGKAGRKSKGKMQKGYFWCFYGDQDEMAFTFSTSRSSQVVEPLLQDFDGVLLTDGYKGYEKLCAKHPKITHAQCWSHSRRYFIKSEKAEPEAAKEALDCIGTLYKVEDNIRQLELEDQEIQDYRQQHAKPLVDKFFDWNREQLRRLDLVPSNPLSKALGYVDKREKELRLYLDNPAVAIDTNHLERGLRCIPMGRKNWMFCWTEEGADNVAVFQTLIMSCRLAGIDPYKYFVDILQRISLHPSRDIRELIPRLWKEKFGPIR